MHIADVEIIYERHGSRGDEPASSRALAARVSRGWLRYRFRRTGLGRAPLAMTGSTLLIILVAVTARTTSTAALLVASAVTAQLLIVVAAVAYPLHQRAGEREAAMASAELGFRAELAEAALDRERDRLHELRATVVGITLSRRMLQERRNELPAPTRSRLEQLQQAELERLERLLDDDARQGSEAVDLGSVVDRLVDAMRIRGHHVLWSGTSHRVWAPSDDVTQIVHVLLTN